MFEFLKNLDRRWIFLLMMLCVAIPIIFIGKTGKTLPEYPTELAQNVFDEIENLNEGDKVLLSFDFDPASEGELKPMATSFVHHCCEKKLKMYFMALWPVGPSMIEDSIKTVIEKYYPHLVYGEDYVNLGFKSGGEGVIKVVVTNMRALYTTDSKGTAIDSIPMMEGIRNVRQMDLIINVSAGSAGTKEWVQYAATPYKDDIRIVGGCTGVQAPLLYPYIPEQLPGLLGAIKGAAEYEKLVNDKYEVDEDGNPQEPRPEYTEGIRRMGPQLVAHLLIIFLIVVANVIYFVERAKGGAR